MLTTSLVVNEELYTELTSLTSTHVNVGSTI